MTQDPASHLSEAIAAMSWSEEPGRFTLVGLDRPPIEADLEVVGAAGQLTYEGGETTLLVRAEHAEKILGRDPSARIERDLVWIRFEAAMGWEVVGFLARVTTALAKEGVPLGAACGFSRDHLFVHEQYLETVREVLGGLFRR